MKQIERDIYSLWYMDTNCIMTDLDNDATTWTQAVSKMTTLLKKLEQLENAKRRLYGKPTINN